MSDFTFTTDGFCITLMPNNSQAEEQWGKIHNVFNGCVIPRSAWDSLKYQLQQAGYTVRKQRKDANKNVDVEALLEELS